MATRNGISKLAVRFNPKELRKAVLDCEAEARRLDAEKQRVLLLASTYRQLIQLQESEPSKVRVTTVETVEAEASESQPKRTLSTRFEGMTIGEAAYAVLLENRGKAMHAREILEAMREGG